MLKRPKNLGSKIIRWVGSPSSIILHTLFFIGMFILPYMEVVDFDTMLLILTTLVSLEAIYLAIFIQMTVNKHSEDLVEVSEDIEEIQEDVGEIQEDVDEIQKDVDELQEDLEEISEEESLANSNQDRTARLERIESALQILLKEINELKKK